MYRELDLREALLRRALASVLFSDIVIFINSNKKPCVRSIHDNAAKRALRGDFELLGTYTKGCDPLWIAEDLFSLNVQKLDKGN